MRGVEEQIIKFASPGKHSAARQGIAHSPANNSLQKNALIGTLITSIPNDSE